MSQSRSRGGNPVFLAWAILVGVTFLPWWLAATRPRGDGLAFPGFFYYPDDQYNYLSFAQQAEDGAFFFANKLVTEPHRPSLVNLEWWAVGRLSALLGSEPALAYRLFGLLASYFLFAGIDRWLHRGGLPHRHRLAALLLVATGGGLGWLLALTSRPLPRCLDLFAGLYPFLGLFVNAHFTAGTALLLFCLDAFAYPEGRAATLRAALLGTTLGLVRPYDLVLLVAIRGLAITLTESPRLWARRLLPLGTLLPVIAWSYQVFYRDRAFAFYARALYVFPPFWDFAWALGPATVLMAVLWRRGEEAGERSARVHLLAWAALGFAMILLRPFHFSLQFLVGIGVPLLACVALNLGRWPLAATLATLLTFGGGFVALLRFLLVPSPFWLVPAERLEIARALRPHCHAGEIVLAPPDIGLYVGGLTACSAWVSHPIGPQYVERANAVAIFYTRLSPVERSAFLDRERIAHVVFPVGGLDEPGNLLASGTAFRRSARASAGRRSLAAYSRQLTRIQQDALRR